MNNWVDQSGLHSNTSRRGSRSSRPSPHGSHGDLREIASAATTPRGGEKNLFPPLQRDGSSSGSSTEVGPPPVTAVTVAPVTIPTTTVTNPDNVVVVDGKLPEIGQLEESAGSNVTQGKIKYSTFLVMQIKVQ